MLAIAGAAGSGSLPRAALPFWVHCLEAVAVSVAESGIRTQVPPRSSTAPGVAPGVKSAESACVAISKSLLFLYRHSFHYPYAWCLHKAANGLFCCRR